MGVTAETSAETGTSGEAEQTAARLFGPRGRHRRPRPRKVLLAAGGLALAAGALSLVRLTPDSDVTGLSATETEPTPDFGTDTGADTDTDRSANAAVTAATPGPKASPSATSVMGALDTTPTTATIVVPTTNPTAPPRPGTTTADGQAPTPAHRPPAQTSQTPRPAPPPPPSRPSPNPPAPQPDDADEDSVCVPVIGLCVDRLTDGD